jgi:hypothetical protein
MDESLFRPFRYCYRTWEDGAVAFQEELIQTALQWQELGFKGFCPFHLPKADEMLVHQRQYKLFEVAQEIRLIVASILNAATDGWVPSEIWEAANSTHEESYRIMLREVFKNEDDENELIRDEEYLREVWPFDVRG